MTILAVPLRVGSCAPALADLGRSEHEPANELRRARSKLRLLHALDGERAEFSVFLADLALLLELRVVTRSLNFFHAIPDLYDGAGRRRAIERSQLLCVRTSGHQSQKRVKPCAFTVVGS